MTLWLCLPGPTHHSTFIPQQCSLEFCNNLAALPSCILQCQVQRHLWAFAHAIPLAYILFSISCPLFVLQVLAQMSLPPGSPLQLLPD